MKIVKFLKNLPKKNRKLYLALGPVFALYRNTVIRCARFFGGTDHNMVVFSSFDYRSYNDNPRYISEALHELRPETDIVWLFKDIEFAKKNFDIPDYVRIEHGISNKGVSCMARARVVVDNFNKRFFLDFPGKKQVYVQTWHGDRAFKKVGFDNEGEYTPLAIETSGHAALKENYFLDDGAYLITRLLIALAKEGEQGRSLTAVLKDLPEAKEADEVRFKFHSGVDFKTLGNQIIASLKSYASTLPYIRLAEKDYEGVRLNFDKDHGNGWLLVRLSLHDPIYPPTPKARASAAYKKSSLG